MSTRPGPGGPGGRKTQRGPGLSAEEQRRNSLEMQEEEKQKSELIFELIRSGSLLEDLDQVDVTLLPKIKDVFLHTPFLCAAENKRTDIMAFLLGKQVSEVGVGQGCSYAARGGEN